MRKVREMSSRKRRKPQKTLTLAPISQNNLNAISNSLEKPSSTLTTFFWKFKLCVTSGICCSPGRKFGLKLSSPSSSTEGGTNLGIETYVLPLNPYVPAEFLRSTCRGHRENRLQSQNFQSSIPEEIVGLTSGWYWHVRGFQVHVPEILGTAAAAADFGEFLRLTLPTLASPRIRFFNSGVATYADLNTGN